MQLQKCDICGKDVELKNGILSIPFRKVREIQDQRADWDKAHRDPPFTLAEVMTFPPRVSWIWHHMSCGIEGSSYWIEADDLIHLRK